MRHAVRAYATAALASHTTTGSAFGGQQLSDIWTILKRIVWVLPAESSNGTAAAQLVVGALRAMQIPAKQLRGASARLDFECVLPGDLAPRQPEQPLGIPTSVGDALPFQDEVCLRLG